MAEITFVGTGEAFDPELPNTSLLYRGDKTLLLDCGYAVPHALWRLSRDPDLLDAVYITHQHADHSFGLPALLLWMREEGRARRLDVIGGPGVGAWLARLLELGYPGAFRPGRCFPIEPIELAPGDALGMGNLTLRNAQSGHGVRNLALRIEEQGRWMCYSGDGRPTAATRELYASASVLVHECYASEQSPVGHATAVELLALARQCSVGRLCLLHRSRYDKQAIDAFVLLQRDVDVVVPRPGDTLPIP